MSAAVERTEHGPWNPGIKSRLPSALLPLATVFRPDNVLTSLDQAHERAAFTGLEPENLVGFRPERLAVHELLIRVTADISVPDGPSYEDLGINFRRIAQVLSRHLAPHMPEICRAYDDLRTRARNTIDAALTSNLLAPARGPTPRSEPGSLVRLLGLARRRKRAASPGASAEERERLMLLAWQRHADRADAPLVRVAHRVLLRLAGAVLIYHGRLPAERTFLASLATELTLPSVKASSVVSSLRVLR
jgi:hypothetical protein